MGELEDTPTRHQGASRTPRHGRGRSRGVAGCDGEQSAERTSARSRGSVEQWIGQQRTERERKELEGKLHGEEENGEGWARRAPCKTPGRSHGIQGAASWRSRDGATMAG
jgi:hypothetical protein